MKRQALICWLIFGSWMAEHAPPAQAAPAISRAIQIPAGPLSGALAQLTRQTGAELLYDQRIIGGARSPEVRGTLSAEQALARLLSGTGVGYRRTAQGVFVLFAAPREPGVAAQQAPVPEILIIGVRTQNADIRRTRNDIQPYVVSTKSDIENAHSDNIGQFMRNRIPADAQVIEAAQDILSGPGFVNSRIDLRGLGTLRTLVLVDGRRMPSLPSPQSDFDQADLNAIPLSAIERIETLTGTAGGIYGPGAIGGVVNIVLRRNYRGADVHLVSGISSRGDAQRLGVEARLGFTPDGGRTNVMMFAARTTVHALHAGERDFAERARAHRFANDAEGYLTDPPPSNAITVFSQEGNLTFDPEFGGGSLRSRVTSIPIGLAGSSADRTALLAANAGRMIFDLQGDDSGANRYLLSNPTVTSAIFNVRHRFSGRVEAFADILYFRDDGRFEGTSPPGSFVTVADAPNNPFEQNVIFRFPNTALAATSRTKLQSVRATAGLLVNFGRGWKGALDVTLGRVKTALDVKATAPSFFFDTALSRGTLGLDGQPLVDPLGDWSRFVTSMATYLQSNKLTSDQANHFNIESLRIAGPLLQLPGGAMNVTLLGERRREHAPVGTFTFAGDTFSFEFPFPLRTQTVTSGYAELRAPVLSRETRLLPLRGLELQLAARYDRVATLFPEDASPAFPSNDRLTRITHAGATFTAGAKLFPWRGLMLRGSIATGELPPTIEQLATSNNSFTDVQFGPADPARGGRRLGTEGTVFVLLGGSHDLKPEKATTIALGAVLNPDGGALPRISIDYSRIAVRKEISPFTASLADVLADESSFPGRIVRAPLSDQDRALGFTAGPVLSVDERAVNAGRSIIEAIDGQLDWSVPAGKLGQLRFYGKATWYPSSKKKDGPGAAWVSRLGYFNTPLKWRGNIGVDWTRGPLLIGLNAQYFDSYRTTYVGDQFTAYNARVLRAQGSARIRSQTYVDLTVRRSFELHSMQPVKHFEVNFGIQNLFDRRPPLVADPSLPGYSFYGDPRRRRFELVLSAGF